MPVLLLLFLSFCRQLVPSQSSNNEIIIVNALNLTRHRDLNTGVGLAKFVRVWNKKLNVLPFQVFSVQGYQTCSIYCAEDPKCLSANFFGSTNGGNLCELLDKDMINHGDKLVAKSDQLHLTFRLHKCFYASPCQNNGTCIPGNNDTYTCKCPYLFPGNHCESALKPVDCWRMSKFPETSKSWFQGGNRDAINIAVDKDVYLLGFHLWGVYSGSAVYSITIQVKRSSQILSSWTGTYASTSSEKTYLLRFPEPVKLVANVAYSLVAAIKGSNAYRGHSGTSPRTCSGVTVTFSVSPDDQNFSNVLKGQIPALEFGLLSETI